MIDIDADLQDADWPKRTPDKLADLADGAQSRAAAKPALALLGPDATEDELAGFVEALTGVPQDRSVPPWWERLTIVRHLPGQHDQKSHAGGGGGAPGAGGGTGTKDDPIRTSDVETAQKALAEGKYVELSSERQVSTLVDRLAADINDARARGETRDYDLCKVSVPKTNLFCSQNVGIPRAQMPQLKGRPIPGSPADALPKNPKGEADISAGFVDYLKASQGIGVSESVIDAKYLKASQNQLDGVKVVGMAQAMREGKIPAESIFVTRDDYIVDGHHRWAANVANEYKQGRAIAMPVRVIDTDIITVLSLANQYAADMGLPTQAYGQRSVVRAGCTDCGTSTLVLGLPEARHLAGQHDQQSHAGGAISATHGSVKPAHGEPATEDPTRLANVSPELAAKVQAQVEKVVPGLTPDAMDANIERALVAGMADPTNDGMTWYPGAHDTSSALAERDGLTVEQSTGIIAATSPQQQWDENLACADYASKTLTANPVVRLDPDTAAKAIEECKTERYEQFRSDPTADLVAGQKRLSDYPPRQQAVIIKVMGQRDGVPARWTCGADGVEKAVRIYNGEDPADVLGGHKVRSFYNNILAPSKPGGYVTIDTHAISAAAGQKITSGDPRMSKLIGVPENAEYGSKGTYGAFADAYRRVAQKYGLNPSQVQAIAWVEWRKNNP